MKHLNMITPGRSLLRALVVLCVAVSQQPAAAQTRQWSLAECCDYAVDHSITIRQQAIACRQQELNLSTARNSRLPDLSANVGQNFSFGRGLTQENTYTNTNTSSTNFGLNTSVPLFTGFRIPNEIKLARLNLEGATADLEKAKNDIRMQVAEAYVQILFNIEIAEVARRQIDIDSAQVARLEAFVRNGKAAEAELSQQRATLANSRLTATQADNNVRLARLTLTQLLELPTPDGFDVVRPDIGGIVGTGVRGYEDSPSASSPSISSGSSGVSGSSVLAPPYPRTPVPPTPIPTPDLIYAEALGVKPEILSQQLKLKGYEHSIKIAQAANYPSLSFSGGIGTNYYTTSGFHSDAFGTQLKNNFSQSLGLNLSIPIFNRFQTRNNIRSARIDLENQQLALDNTKKTLYQEIQKVYYNAVNAQEKQRASEEAVISSKDAFDLMQAKYENGKATITEFNESKNNYLKAESDLVQARYENLYQRALIDFYRGRPLAF